LQTGGGGRKSWISFDQLETEIKPTIVARLGAMK
jgi:hypothetical protein